MRRSLVLIDEGAKHPFRRSLPPQWRAQDDANSDRADNPPFWRLTASDVKGAVTTYFAVFAAVLIFIA